MSLPYTKTASSLSLTIDFVPTVVPSSHPNYQQIVELVRKPETTEADVAKLLIFPKDTETFKGGNVTIVNGRLFYKGYEVRNNLAQIILDFVKAGDVEGAKPFEAFMENAFQNPDPRAATDLYDWVAHSGLPITPTGEILAWKAVTADYRSIHSPRDARFDHHVGNIVEEDRRLCDANPNRTCSSGLHFCSGPYLKSYAGGGSRIVAVKINPRDVVAFPTDYGWEKGRACRYEIVGEVPLEKVSGFYPSARPIYDWKAPAPAKKSKPKTAPKFSVGQVWFDGNGKKVKIVEVKTGGKSIYKVVGSNKQQYTVEGHFYGSGTPSANDLVKKFK